MKHLLCATLAVALLGGLFTTLPAAAEDGQDWPKTEEPALRPYKAMGRGFAAFWYQTVQSLAVGNEKLPFFGSVEVFRGMRRGVVEFAEHTTTGMAHSQGHDWKQTGAANAVIDDDILLRNVADFATAAAIARVPGNSTEDTLLFAGAVWAGQKATDRSPFDPNKDARLEARIQRAQESYLMKSGHGALSVGQQAEAQVEDPRWKRAQRSYIGARADVNPRSNRGGGNLLTMAR